MRPLRGVPPRFRVGVVAPFDWELDWELWRWTPPDAALYVTRTPVVDGPVNVEFAADVGSIDVVVAGVHQLAMSRPAVVAYACTSGSFVNGLASEKQLRAAMEEAGAPRAITTSGAMLEALAALGLGRIGVATPYDEALTERLCSFLNEAGVEVGPVAHLGLGSEIAHTDETTVAELVRRVSRGVEGVFVSCTNLPTIGLVESLESETGRPVLSANLVTIWASLRMAGVPGRPVSSPELLFRASG